MIGLALLLAAALNGGISADLNHTLSDRFGLELNETLVAEACDPSIRRIIFPDADAIPNEIVCIVSMDEDAERLEQDLMRALTQAGYTMLTAAGPSAIYERDSTRLQVAVLPLPPEAAIQHNHDFLRAFIISLVGE
ncbi:MAG: hypothetical protein GYB36_10400 [Alphaproteobacteria bacterium]|nr:hypothetical protein [Alphaproteobacteria bacterium]